MTTSKETVDSQKLALRKLRILDLLSYKGQLSKELKIKILSTNDMPYLQDLHDSIRSIGQAKEYVALKMGMDHLASILWRQDKGVDPRMDALAFFNEKSEVKSQDQALAVARDIIAERVKDNKEAKKELRNFIKSNGTLALEIIREDHFELADYKTHFPTSPISLPEKIDNIAKILEAESKGIAALSINIPEEECLKLLDKFFIKKETACGQHVRMAIKDSYQRFLLPSIEMDMRSQLHEESSVKKIQKVRPIIFLIVISFFILCLLAFKTMLCPIPDGVQKRYYSNGILKSEVTYKNGKLDGIFKKYYSNGQVMSIEGYLNGKRDGGFRKFNPNGQIILFIDYRNGILDGESREYYDNGQWKTIKNYQDGQLEGFVQEYSPDGRLKRQTYYHNNIPLPHGYVKSL